MAKKNQLSVKLLINKEKNKVVFVETEGDFINVLFSLLTLPMGTIVRLLETQSSSGCMDNLYKSAAKLNKQHLQTLQCFDMLSRPRRAYETICRSLKINIDSSEPPMKYYMCPESMCSYDMLSTVENSRCCCGEMMTEEKELVEEGDGFVQRAMKYIVTDDMQIMPVSTSADAFSLLKELGFTEVNKLVKQPVVIGSDEVLLLLKRALVSDEPFTGVFLRKHELARNVKVDPGEMPESIDRNDELVNGKMISLKLMVSRSKNIVVYAEARADFLDFLFSFLTFPLGSIIKLLCGKSSLGCVDNLYRSVNNMILNNCMNSDRHSGILLNPKLPQHFNCSSQLLGIEEASLQYCHLCFEGRLSSDFPCAVHEMQVKLNVVDPKSPTGKTTVGEGFMKEEITYMVTDKLSVNPLSPMQAITYLNNLNVSVDDIEEHVVLMGEEEGLKLLTASLTSKTVLNDVFTPKIRMRSIL